jgi:hypothetical protein
MTVHDQFGRFGAADVKTLAPRSPASGCACHPLPAK